MYAAADDRYERMQYRRCGRSGLKLPAISLGLWYNANVDALDKLDFTAEELAEIDRYATESGINIWARSSSG